MDPVTFCYRVHSEVYKNSSKKAKMFIFQIVNKFALPVVIVVVLCIFCTFIGIFLKFNGSDSLR